MRVQWHRAAAPKSPPWEMGTHSFNMPPGVGSPEFLPVSIFLQRNSLQTLYSQLFVQEEAAQYLQNMETLKTQKYLIIKL